VLDFLKIINISQLEKKILLFIYIKEIVLAQFSNIEMEISANFVLRIWLDAEYVILVLIVSTALMVIISIQLIINVKDAQWYLSAGAVHLLQFVLNALLTISSMEAFAHHVHQQLKVVFLVKQKLNVSCVMLMNIIWMVLVNVFLV